MLTQKLTPPREQSQVSYATLDSKIARKKHLKIEPTDNSPDISNIHLSSYQNSRGHGYQNSVSSEFNRADGSLPTSAKKTFAKSPPIVHLKNESLDAKHK